MDTRIRGWWWLGGVLAALCLCIAFADFSTKGEPREALVAADMLASGDWTLPVDTSGDMAYKPPMFHWLVALCSLPAGHVTVFTARLPSALALTGLVAMTAWWCGWPRRRRFCLAACGIMLTCFEVFRAGTVCRVDMVLTFFMAGAMMLLFRSTETPSPRRTLPLLGLAALFLSGAALTKGPVGILLPLVVYWVYMLASRRNMVKATLVCVAVGAVGCILPAFWYFAAYLKGGDAFYALAYEENIGRLLGHMSYESHVKPFWYNFLVLAAGTLPWCALALGAWVRELPRNGRRGTATARPTRNDALRFAVVAMAVVFVFYTIPKSKRGVYLLPMYPFIAYCLALYARHLISFGRLKAQTLRQTLIVVGALFVFGFGAVFPVIAAGKSDAPKAEAIGARVPGGAIYSYIPDRFQRYYCLNYYLGGRVASLLPSGQTSGRAFSTSDIRLPRPPFYLLTSSAWQTAAAYAPLDSALRCAGLRATPLYQSETKTCDTADPVILLKVE